MKMKKLVFLSLSSFLIIPSFAANVYRCPNKQDIVKNGQWFCPVGWKCTRIDPTPPPLANFDFNGVFLNNNYLTRTGQCIYSYIRSDNVFIAAQVTDAGNYSGLNPDNWKGGGGNSWVCTQKTIDACKFQLS